VLYPATMANSQVMDVDAFRCTSVGYGNHPQIVACDYCGHVFANPRWSDEEIVAAYTAVEDQTYISERVGRELTFRKHLAEMEQHVGPANGRSLLDVGAYIGVFVEMAQAAGWNAAGVEPSTWAAEEAQRRGLHIIQGTQAAPDLQGRQFDVITMWDVIEHVAEPLAEVQKAHQLLKPSGWLVVHTMDIDSPVARLMGSRWPWLMDMHLHYFSRQSMAYMLAQAGFEVVWSGAQGRYLRLGYLASRLGGLSDPVGHLAEWGIDRLSLAETAVPVNFGDLFTAYARKK
jgi:2-polyprenyl-3-methyl-5-hydroxy-6-metoxy-1,4-benzoquinol methylase